MPGRGLHAIKGADFEILDVRYAFGGGRASSGGRESPEDTSSEQVPVNHTQRWSGPNAAQMQRERVQTRAAAPTAARLISNEGDTLQDYAGLGNLS